MARALREAWFPDGAWGSALALACGTAPLVVYRASGQSRMVGVNTAGLGARPVLGGQEVGAGTRSDEKALFSSWCVLKGLPKL